MTDTEFFSHLVDCMASATASRLPDAVLQSQADILIGTGRWKKPDRAALVQALAALTTVESGYSAANATRYSLEAMRCLGRQVHNFPHGEVLVGFSNTPKPTPCAIKNPDGNTIILMNSRFEGMLHLVLYLSIAIISYHGPSALDKSHEPMQLAESLLLTAASIGNQDPEAMLVSPTPDLYEKALNHPSIRRFVEVVNTYMLLQEYGHLILGHYDNGRHVPIRVGSSEFLMADPSVKQLKEVDEFATEHLYNYMPSVAFGDVLYPVAAYYRFLHLAGTFAKRPLYLLDPSERWERIKRNLPPEDGKHPMVHNVDAIYNNLLEFMASNRAP